MKSISLFIGTLVFYLFLVGFVNAQTERKYTYQALDIQLPPGTVKIIELADLNTDRGEIVGTGADAEHKWHGLIINRFTGVAARHAQRRVCGRRLCVECLRTSRRAS
jgi:hypothetical protein